MRELRGKVAVVTGAASGMGRAMATRFGAEGMLVVLADVDGLEVEAAAAELVGGGVSAIGVPTDVSSAESVDALAKRAVAEFGAVHVVCNNAGVGGTGGLAWELPFSAWEWMIRVNFLGVVHGVRAFVPLLVEQGEGHVVNTSSMAGLAAGMGSTPYTATKYAVAGLSEALQRELEMIGSPVKVSVLIPGPVQTRISQALRNWPSDLGPVPEARQADRVGVLPIPPVLQRAFESLMQPSEVADLVLDGVRNDRFWIVTHPAEVAQVVRERTEGLVAPDATRSA
jgi:NAD(P)-dependent dehydrogenase (short-subunit alcohol dehydrogenase family)